MADLIFLGVCDDEYYGAVGPVLAGVVVSVREPQPSSVPRLHPQAFRPRDMVPMRLAEWVSSKTRRWTPQFLRPRLASNVESGVECCVLIKTLPLGINKNIMCRNFFSLDDHCVAELLFGASEITKMDMMALFSRLKPALKPKMVELRRNQNGQTMVEYVMLIVLVALAVFLLSPNIVDPILAVFQNTSSALAWSIPDSPILCWYQGSIIDILKLQCRHPITECVILGFVLYLPCPLCRPGNVAIFYMPDSWVGE